MPNTAFVVRNYMQNTFSNNVIFNAKTGFEVPFGDAGVDELIINNRFVNVENKTDKVALSKSEDTLGGMLSSAPPIIIKDKEFLPEPSKQLQGQMILFPDGKSDKLMICRHIDGIYCWQELQAGTETIEPVVWNEKQETEVELITENMEGWTFSPVDSKIGFGKAGYKNGEKTSTTELLYDDRSYDKSGSAHIVNLDRNFSWSLKRNEKLHPGGVYRIKTRFLTSSNIPSVVLLIDINGKEERVTRRSRENNIWEELVADITLPDNGNGEVEIKLTGSRFGKTKSVWIDSVSIVELERKK
jgi:hypothetical protein